MNRYINLTLIDEHGTATSTQVMTMDKHSAIRQMDQYIAEGFARVRGRRPFVAAFIFDTMDNSLLHYHVDGLRAKLVTGDNR